MGVSSPKITNNIAVSSPFGNGSRFNASKSPMLPPNSPLLPSNSPHVPSNSPLSSSNSPLIQTTTQTNKPGSSSSFSVNQNKYLHKNLAITSKKTMNNVRETLKENNHQKLSNSSIVHQGRNLITSQAFVNQFQPSTNHNQALAKGISQNQLNT